MKAEREVSSESKSAVDFAWNRKLLGYSFWIAPGRVVKRRVAKKALTTMKERVRLITRRTGGRSIEQTAAALRSYLVGWKGYFRLADTPRAFAELDEWIRHRLRAIHLKHWNRGTTIFRELRVRGLSVAAAAKGEQRPALVEKLRDTHPHCLPHPLFRPTGHPPAGLVTSTL